MFRRSIPLIIRWCETPWASSLANLNIEHLLLFLTLFVNLESYGRPPFSKEETKFQVVEAAKNELAQKFSIIDVDGVRVVFEDGWGLIRASNTQPVLVLRFEARSPERLQEIQNLIEEVLHRIQKKFWSAKALK